MRTGRGSDADIALAVGSCAEGLPGDGKSGAGPGWSTLRSLMSARKIGEFCSALSFLNFFFMYLFFVRLFSFSRRVAFLGKGV